MQIISTILPIVQLVLAILLIVLVLLQRSSDGIEGALGGGASNMTYFARRGAERILFISTIVVAVLFAASAILAILV